MPSVKNVIDTIGKKRLKGQGGRRDGRMTAADSFKEAFGINE